MTFMTVKEILSGALNLYADRPSHALKAHWPDPGTYCLVTALDKVGGYCYEAEVAEAEVVLAKSAGTKNVYPRNDLISFNATHSTEEVIKVFRKAIDELS